MKYAITLVSAYLQQMGCSVEELDEAALMAPVDMPRGSHLCSAKANEQQLIFESLYAFTVPSSRRMLAAEFVVRANAYAKVAGVGALNLELDDGEIGFKSAIPLQPEHLSLALVAALIDQHLEAADRWLPGVAAVCFTDVAPRAALKQCVDTSSLREMIEFVNERFDQD